MSTSPLHELAARGQSVWIDYLSRDLVHGGGLARAMAQDGVVGVTSTPTIFQKALSSSDVYDAQLREVLADERDPKEVFLRLALRGGGGARGRPRPGGG